MSVQVSCQLAADVFVPSDTTFRLSIWPPKTALKMPRSFQAKFASAVPNVARQVMTLALRCG